MITWIDVLAIVIALGLAVLGVLRGYLRELLVSLAGIVLGVVMATLWGTAWSGALAERLQGDPRQLQGIVSLVSLYFVVIFVGYGTSIFLPRRPLAWWHRALGGLLGLLNGLFLIAFTFGYIQQYLLGDPPPADSILTRSLLASTLVYWLPSVLLGIILVIFVAVVIAALVRLARFISRLVQEPAPVAVPPLPPAPAAPQETEAPADVADLPEEPTVPCPNCGQPVSFGAAHCPQCGKTIS